MIRLRRAIVRWFYREILVDPDPLVLFPTQEGTTVIVEDPVR